MMKNTKPFAFALLLCCALTALPAMAKDYTLRSPNGRLSLTVRMNKGLSYAVSLGDTTLINFSPISLRLKLGDRSIEPTRVSKAQTGEHKGSLRAFAYKKAEVSDHYRYLTLTLNDGLRLEARAYDEGVAYRFVAQERTPYVVEQEQATFRFAADDSSYVPYVNRKGGFEQQFENSFENAYRHGPLSTLDTSRLAFTPIIVETASAKIALAESDLENYPGMYLRRRLNEPTLEGVWAAYPERVEVGSYRLRQLLVKSRKPYLAQCAAGQTNYPWRIVNVARTDQDLLGNDMVYRLASPNRIGSTDWIRPGKVSWDWWNNFGLYGVPFKAGINTQTYKYYIDFAARYGLEYILLDEGWSVYNKNDLMLVVPELNLPELVRYGREKGVGLILWAGWAPFEKDMERVCRHYAEMGIKGFKVDFMNRDDALMVHDLYRAAETAARYKLVLDFHGMYKPTGLNRTYPNVLNFEGVMGLEQNRWSTLKDFDQVTYDCVVPFARMLAGSMDYTQGAMINGQKPSYRPSHLEPMSQGTRCRQLAEYVVFLSPLNMLSDSPSRYIENDECTRFIASTPVVWDETRPLKSKIGDYVAVARRKGSTWYVAAINNWQARSLTLDLSSLGLGGGEGEAMVDGPNAAHVARDYAHTRIKVPVDGLLKVTMAPGGGFVMKISR